MALIDEEFDDGKSDTNGMISALFQCQICGYVYEGNAIPYEYECPVCGQQGHGFMRIR